MQVYGSKWHHEIGKIQVFMHLTVPGSCQDQPCISWRWLARLEGGRGFEHYKLDRINVNDKRLVELWYPCTV